MTLDAFIKRTGQTLQEHSPTILTALGVAGVASTAFLANRAGFQASVRLYEVEEAKGEPLTGKEKVDIAWKLYIPTALAAAGAVACIISANAISTRRQAAAMSAIALSETAFREYKEKVVEVAGKDKENRATKELAQEKIDQTPNSEVVLIGNDNILCFDTLTARYFESNKMEIQKAEVEFNRQILNDMYASQNEWYDRIGLGRIENGDDMGWNNDAPLEVIFDALMKDDKPVMALKYRFRPVPDFHKFG